MLPPLRDIAQHFGVSFYLAQQVVESLGARGVLHTVPRVGIFAGAGSRIVGEVAAEESEFSRSPKYFLMMLGNVGARLEAKLKPCHVPMRVGFEDRIAQLGGAVLTMSQAQAQRAGESGELPLLHGVFDLAQLNIVPDLFGAQSLPMGRVRIGSVREAPAGCDLVSFDDEGGGWTATRHLLQHGHRDIAFLGLHTPGHEQSGLFWSREREVGWRRALKESGLDGAARAFHPPSPLTTESSRAIVRAARVAASLLWRGAPTATGVVAANANVARGLFLALEAAGVPSSRWPSVVAFDDDPSLNPHVLSSLRLPWEELGRTAADLLWERAQGRLPSRLPAAGEHRAIAMRLIPRLSGRPDWLRAPGQSALELMAVG